VFALKRNGAGDGGATAHSVHRGSLVLPRPLRRVAHFLSAPTLEQLRFPRHSSAVLTVAFLGATGIYGMVLGGHSAHVMSVGTALAGFAVEDVVVSGNAETSEIDILQQLGLDGSTSVMALDAAAARQALLDLPWVEDAEVRKVYPDTLQIELTERQAFAIWQNGSELTLIERNGAVIAPMAEKRYAHLPLYVGLGAESRAEAFDTLMLEQPALRERVRAYVRVADRRWDLHLHNGLIVKLPERGEAQALAELAAMDRDQDIFDRDIAAIDMRLADRITIRLTPESLERRQAAIEKRAKDLKAQERRI
jgi:cell division protein FtsQ